MDKSRKRKLEITTEENTDEERLQLLRKLDRAVAKGKATRESSLRTRLAALDASKRESPRVFSKPIQKAVDGEIIGSEVARLELLRKLSRAVSKGKVDREALLRARLAALDEAPLESLAETHDRENEEKIQKIYAGVLESDKKPPSMEVIEVPEGMVLGKNGKLYPKPPPAPPGNTTLLLFYAYVQPPWNSRARSAALDFARSTLSTGGCTGRLRVALEGFNGTLTGPAQGIRAFCDGLRSYAPEQFGNTDFKFVDGLADNKMFRELKVWPVEELVTYGFSVEQAPLNQGGKHVSPAEWTELSKRPNTVMIDVRNANETAIGRFAPPTGGAVLLDPRMRRSTEFPEWVDKVLPQLEGKNVLMYCTGGVRWWVDFYFARLSTLVLRTPLLMLLLTHTPHTQ